MVEKTRQPAGNGRNGPEEAQVPTGKELLRGYLAVVAVHLKRPFVIGAIFALAYVSVGVIYLQGLQENRTLTGDLNARQSVLSLQLPADHELQGALSTWTEAIQAASRLQVPELADSDLLERTLDAAGQSGVIVFSAGTTQDGEEDVNGESYQTSPVLIRATGGLPNLMNFVSVLEGGAIEAFEIKNSLLTTIENDYVLTLRAVVFSQNEPQTSLSSGGPVEGLVRDGELVRGIPDTTTGPGSQ